MRKFLLETAKVVGTATEKSWSQVHLFSPSDSEKQLRRGELLAVLSLSGLDEGVEAVAAGREIISRLHEEYYGNLEGKALEQLGKAVRAVVAEASAEAKTEIGAMAVVGEILYLAIAGQGQVIFQRNNQIGILLEGDEKVITASGYLQSDDLFLLGTEGFFQAVANGVLRAALATGSPEEISETLAPVIHGRPESGTATAVICQVKATLKEEKLIPIPPAEKEIPSPKTAAKTASAIFSKPLAIIKPVKTKLKESLEKGAGRFSLRLQRHLGKKAVYLKQNLKKGKEISGWRLAKRPERSKKSLFTVVLILLLLLGISLVLGAKQRARFGSEQKTAALLNEAQQKKEEATALLELNPPRAQELLLEAQTLIQQAEAKGLKSDQLATFKNELQEALDQVLKEHQAEAFVFLDLELIKKEARGNSWATSGKKIMILDKGKNSVYELGIEDKKSTILAGGKSLENASQIAAFLPRAFVLTDQAIIEIDRLTKKEKVAVEADDQWEKIIDFNAFAANLYLLDKSEGIWQYPAMETGFGSRRRWLKGETTPDFSDAVSMAIDGSIWVLKANGTIWKFTRGTKDAFGVAGLGQAFNQPAALYTDDDCQNLYILDKGNSQVVVLAKSGEYEATYLWEGLREVDDLIADEEEKEILLLKGSKIYQIEIK